MESSIADDDSALPIDDQKNRPQDIRVQQQRIQAWNPILDPEWMIYAFLTVAIIMIPVGKYFLSFLNRVVACDLKNYDIFLNKQMIVVAVID